MNTIVTHVTLRSMLAAELVLVFEHLCRLIGKARALVDPAVQAARRAYRSVCA